MKSVRREHRLLRVGLVAVLTSALLAQVGTNQATAGPVERTASGVETSADRPLTPRAKALILWRSGGDQVKAAAEKALLGSDAEVEAFLNQKLDRLVELDDRIAVNRILAAGGPATRSAAQAALDAGDTDPDVLRDFLITGWSNASNTDLRIRVNQIYAAGGAQVQRAAQAALDDGSPEALRNFLEVTSVQAANTDLRIRVNQIYAAGGPAVRAAAQTALDAETPEALRLFISREWEVAEARDQETASIAQLVAAAKLAGEQAAQETQAAKDSADKALREADLARQAAELAAEAAEAAKNNAAGAAEAANQAATAANRAASAATTAIGAANAATTAARIAANAATRAAAAATKAGQASSTAWNFAAAARVDRGRAGDAARAAIGASNASNEAQQAVQAIDLAQNALSRAQEAVNAANSAGSNANQSAEAAQEAVRWARSAGADASAAEAAAARSRAQAGLANRAAASARAYAVEAADAASRARELAAKAVIDALLASAAADEAARRAGEAENAARLATEHANAASNAAQIAVDSAAQAARLYNAARQADSERLTIQAEQAALAARQANQVSDHLGLVRRWSAPQQAQRDAQTNQWLAEATAPGADPALVAANGRKIALKLVATSGPWSKAAAASALSGADPEVREYVRTGIAQAAALDDRETVQQLIADAPQSKKNAGNAALAGSDADVRRFLESPDYPERGTDLRIEVNQVLAAARDAGDATVAAAAQRALDSGTVAAYSEFLDTGQNSAREHDDRIAINQLIANPNTGPEARLLGQAALEGPPELIRQYRHGGQHIAIRHDREAAAHNAVVAAMVAEAASVASTALQNAATAQSVAATARKAAEEAAGYARQAAGHADAAARSANEALASAEEAKASAERAARSAETAVQAAARASQSAVRAARSAVSARSSANIAAGHATSAMQAAHQAYQDAVDAGADAEAAVNAANEARSKAIDKANREIAAEKARFAEQVNNACNNVPPGPERDDCVTRAQRMIADPKGESERNVAICNQLKQGSEQAFNECLKGAYNPALTYIINKAIADAESEAEAERWWTIAGFVVAGAVVIGAGMFCAQVCTAPLAGALIGAEAGFLATAAGAGIEVAIGAEFLTGVVADSFLASRLGALAEVNFLGGVAVRGALVHLDLNVIRQAAGSCVTSRVAIATSLCLIAVQYWASDIARVAYDFRRVVPAPSPGINVAVAKLPGWNDPVFKDDYIRALSGERMHSEQRIIDTIKKRNEGLPEGQRFDPKEITEFFTERSPCSDPCQPLLRTELSPEAKIYYVVQYVGGNSKEEAQMLNELLSIMAGGGF
ncbi:hypothetical protein JOF41_000574 [Saccharothrix coeruleofusca]|uniref:hypothetical protein n=1 Tax=Saccharothrix coeruleofusca TaxID=33919 RepID=UPI001AE807F4|nr:hypothetical protein [Saccharothrix coeruleofusca]MBP2334396.1 hypothetical protein [Saccharothrix coeruleofusca]